MLMDLDALRGSRLRDRPWRWALLERAFQAGLEDLVSTFPMDGFTMFSRTDDEKPYQMAARPLIKRGAREPEHTTDLAPVWQRLVEEVRDPAYATALGAMCGRDLGKLELEATLWRYDAGCWLAPHPDKPEKVVSQVFYFNPAWNPAWGGVLRVLRSSTMDDYAVEVPPIAGSAVVIERSDDSWHAVTAVTSTDVPPRQSLQVAFYDPSAAV
jgi:SM-20-related protein